MDKGYDPKYGARPINRAIEKYIENVLAESLLKDEIVPNEQVVLILNSDNKVSVS